MKEWIDLVIDNPLRAIATFALMAFFTLALFTGKYLVKRLTTQFESFEKKMNLWEHSIRKIQNSTKVALNNHSIETNKTIASMESNTKIIENSLASLQRDLLNKIGEATVTAIKLEAETQAISRVFTSAIGDFDVRFANIIEIRKELVEMQGTIKRVDCKSEEFKIMQAQTQKQMTKVAEILSDHGAKLKELKGTK